MSRDSEVTFEVVSQACYEILSRGERPSRPSVQELLATERYIGRKGSNDLVQKYVNDFWVRMAKTLQVPSRTVDGVPAAFVPIIDKALVEMVAIARQITTDEFAERDAALVMRAQEMEASVRDARDSAVAADQLRIRAEGELSAMQTRADELKSNLAEAERKLAEETRKVEAHQRAIDEKDAELRGQFSSLEAARRALEQAGEQHRQEVHRLMQQLDSERQLARKEARRLTDQLDISRKETGSVREEAALLREEIAGLKAERVAAAARQTNLEASLKEAKDGIENAESKLKAVQQEFAVLRVRFETSEQHLHEATARCTSQGEELSDLRHANEQLMRQIAALQVKSPRPRKSHAVRESGG